MDGSGMAPTLDRRAGTSPVAVIGAAGFIGRRLVAGLRSARVPTACFTRHIPWRWAGRVDACLPDARTVFYLASSVTPALAERRPDLVTADRMAFVALLDELRRLGRRPTVVFAASGGTAYDPAVAPPYAESSPVGPTTEYGRAKLGLEQDLLARADAVHPVVLRLANVYGPGQRSDKGLGVVPHWLEAGADGRPLKVLGDPDTSRDYVYVDDTVQAMIRVHQMAGARAGDLPRVINIGSGVPISLTRLLGIVTDTVGASLSVEHHARRSFDRRAAWLDVRLARQTLDWCARTPLTTGLSRTWRALLDERRAHGDREALSLGSGSGAVGAAAPAGSSAPPSSAPPSSAPQGVLEPPSR